MHDLRSHALRARFALTPVALVAAALLQPGVAAAQQSTQTDANPPKVAQPKAPAKDDTQPTYVSGERITGRPDLETVIEGDAEVRRGDTVIRADRLEYYPPEDLARAQGNVRIDKAGNTYEGPELQLKLDSFEGFFNQPRYHFLRNDAYGQADRVDFLDDKRAVVRNATYTTCKRQPGPDWMPDWILRATSLSIDNEEEVGKAEGGVLDFKGVPILPLPSASFPLSDKRKSGLLPPTIGADSLSGIEYTQPYYWDIAPNRDATFYPTLMSKRGVDLGGEFRYLESNYSGQLRGDYLPSDLLRNRDRWAYSLMHQGTYPVGGPLSPLGLNLNVNRVSDNDYWRDFSRTTGSFTQRLLSADGTVSWTRDDFSLSARALKWQTLQDPLAPIVPPYDRLPQVVGKWQDSQLPAGLDGYVETDFTKFRSVPFLTNQPDAERSFALLRLSRPWQAPGWFFTPKVQLHTTHYQFDTPLANGMETADRTVPTYSLDSGLIFERDASLWGRAYRQTLEPRAFYVYTPFRDQNYLPNYDSAPVDFNFATIYTENSFGGNDRIADNNLLTLGATTRLLNPDTGAEAARFGMAQRLRFTDQLVTLPGQPPVSERISDLLFGASINWVPQWSTDTTVQYNPKTNRSERSTIGVRYSPSNYHVVSAAYRLQRGLSEQMDIGWQWPLNDLWGDKGEDLGPGRGQGPGRWYSVGRLNYSIKDSRLVDSVGGFEYDAGCWIGRIVLERLQSGLSTANTRILFQMEFVGFARLGTNALQALKENIPRYQYLRERTSTPGQLGGTPGPLGGSTD